MDHEPPETQLVESARRQDILRILAWGLLGLAALHVILVFALAPILPEDDAFITLRYARNLDEGIGFVFNPGERVLGTSSPAHALMLAAVGRVTGIGALPRDTVVLNGLWILLAAVGALWLFEGLGLGFPLPQLGAAWFLLAPSVLEMGLGGMEICLFACTAVWALALAVRSHWAAAAALAATSLLVRPEGVLLFVVLTVLWWRSGRPRPVVAAVVAGGILGTWSLFATLYFGSPVPQSVVAKIGAAGAGAPGDTARQLMTLMASWLFGGRAGLPGSGSVGLAGVVAFGLTLGLMLATLVPAAKRWLAPAAACPPLWLAAAGGYAVSNPYWFPWYAMMVLVPWWLTLISGTAGLQVWLRRRLPSWSRAPLLLLSFVLAAGLVGAAGAITTRGWPGTAYGVATPYRARILSYASAARWLNANAPDGSTVLSSEIGTIGYLYRRGPILDVWGLVTPEVLETGGRKPVSGVPGTSIPPELVRALRPAYVLGFAHVLRALEANPSFTESYRLLRVFAVPGRNYPYYRLRLYERIAGHGATNAGEGA